MSHLDNDLRNRETTCFWNSPTVLWGKIIECRLCLFSVYIINYLQYGRSMIPRSLYYQLPMVITINLWLWRTPRACVNLVCQARRLEPRWKHGRPKKGNGHLFKWMEMATHISVYVCILQTYIYILKSSLLPMALLLNVARILKTRVCFQFWEIWSWSIWCLIYPLQRMN
jgi:hypothetical protein